MTHFLKKQKNIILVIGLLVLGIIVGVGITTASPLLTGITKAKTEPLKIVDETEVKKQALTKFYSELSSANDKKDWAKLYTLAPQSVRGNVTQDQYVSYQKSIKNQPTYRSTTVHSIKVDGNKGTVERTLVICVTKECIGDNRKEDKAKREYVYTDGSWQIPDPEPSERASKAVAYLYVTMSEDEQKKLINDNGYGSDSVSFATRNYAIFFDENPDKLVILEAWIDKNKAERNRPVVNYQPPAINIEQQAPVVQQNSPTNCTSNTIGSYTYTNCY